MFTPVAAKYDGPELERGILDFWASERIFERIIEQGRDRELFVFYEGPPTANGRPGIHHVLARTFKDLYPRYKTMQGFHCPRKAGWDTHGLPVEIVSGLTLDRFFAERIFGPLGMSDTSFALSPDKAHRMASCYLRTEGDGMALVDTGRGSAYLDVCAKKPCHILYRRRPRRYP